MTDADPSRAHTGRRFRRAARSPLAGAALVIICLVAYLPGLFTMPPVDRDESRFAQATRQMVEGVREADSPAEVIEALAVPMIQDRPRLNKPPLVYWVQAIPAGVLGLDRAERDIGRAWFGAALPTGNIGAFRVASVFCSILAVVFTWRLGLRLFEPRTAFVAAALLGTCIMVLWDARQARADQLLLACTAASMWALAATWRRPRPTSRERKRADGPPQDARASSPLARARGSFGVPAWVALWIAVGLGVLAKGPITPLIIVTGALAAAWSAGRWSWFRSLRPLAGVAIVLAICLPWVAAVAWAQGGIGAYANEVWQEVFVRAAGGKEHFIPIPGYHLVLLAVLFFPGSLVTLIGLVRAWRVMVGGKARGHGGEKAPGTGHQASVVQRCGRAVRGGWATPSAETVLVCLIVPTWLIFEATPAKLPHYTLPLYPCIALLTARALMSAAAGTLLDVRTRGAVVGMALFWLLTMLIASALAAVWVLSVAPDWMGYATGLIGGIVGVAVLVTRDRAMLAQSVIWLWALLSGTLALGVAIPRLLDPPAGTWVSSQLVGWLDQGGVDRGTDRLLAHGYVEDSLIFLTRGRTERVSFDTACAWMRGDRDPGSILVLGEPLDRAVTPQSFSARCDPRTWAEHGSIGSALGLNTANFRHVGVTIYTPDPDDSVPGTEPPTPNAGL